MNIDDLELTIRSHNGLKNAGITTVEQLINLDWDQLRSIENLGKKSVTEICWSCIELLNGRMLERCIEWENQRANIDEMKSKSKKYDEIEKIINRLGK